MRPSVSRRTLVCSLGLLLFLMVIAWSARTMDLMSMLRRMHGM